MATQQISQYNFIVEQEQLNHFLGPVQGALGGLPVAEQLQDYFIVYQQAGGTGPEIIDETDGDISKPVEGYPSQENLLQNFGIGSNVVVRNDASTTLNSQIAGLHKVTAIGRQVPLLYTQNGFYTSSFSETIQYLGTPGVGLEAPGTAPYFLARMINPSEASEYTTPLTSTPLNLTLFEKQLPTPDPDVAELLPDNTVTATNYTFGSNIHDFGNIQTVTFQLEGIFHNYYDDSYQIEVELMKDGESISTKSYTIQGANPEGSGIPVYSGPNGNYQALNTGNDPLTFTFVTSGEVYYSPTLSNKIESGMVITARVSTAAMEGGAGTVYMPSFTFSAIGQTPNASTPVDSSQTGVQWSTGSLYPQLFTHTWLTASYFISQGYGLTQNSSHITDNSEANFNLSPIEVPFIPKVGDRIRFEYNKTTDYFIYEVIPPNLDSQNRLKFRINAPIPPRVERENFIIHRTNPSDPAYIILDINKNSIVSDTQNFNGLILPEYPTQKLKDNLDRITVDLKERGIITDNEA